MFSLRRLLYNSSLTLLKNARNNYCTSCRFTPEEENAFSFLQKQFGHDFLTEHGMIVVTHGDLLKIEAADKNMSSEQFFRKWCISAGDKFNSLINMVSDRILLVGNRGTFENNNERIVSSKKIHEIAVKMFNKSNPYTKEEFDKMHKPCEIL
nr:GTPase IMAP family member 8-like [Biomphalaria glabrata]